MKRFFLIIPLIASLLLSSCGGAFVAAFFDPGAASTSISGTVSIVHLGFVDDGHGTSVMFTAVTLINAGSANTVNFCGDHRSQFPMNQLVRVQFNQGTFCSGLVVVVIVSG